MKTLNLLISILMIGILTLSSCDPCRNGRACHRNGTKTKKKQIKKSKNKQRNQNLGGGFSM